MTENNVVKDNKIKIKGNNNIVNIGNGIIIKFYVSLIAKSKEEINDLLNEFEDAIKNKIVDIICNNSNQMANDKNKEGVKCFIDKKYKEALQCFNEAIEIDASIPEIHYNLGNTKLLYI